MTVDKNIYKIFTYISLAIVFACSSSTGFSSTPPPQSFSVSYQNFSDDDFSFSGPSLYLRKTLLEDALSIKGQYRSLSIEDESSNQINAAEKYSETQSTLALGVDYYYYDTSLSLTGHYTGEDTSSDSSIGIDLTQGYGNGNSFLRMGFTHGWEDDSDLGLHNKSRTVRFGNGRTLRKTWQLYAELQFSSQDGDLQDFRSARRFSDITRVVLPNGRSDQQLKVISSNDIGKNRYLKSEFLYLTNDWGQTGNSVELALLKPRSEKLTLQYHIKLSKLGESKYYESSLLSLTQDFYSDHRKFSKQDSQELGITSMWKLNTKEERWFKNLAIDAGYTYMKNEYATEDGISNTGSAIFVHFSGNY